MSEKMKLLLNCDVCDARRMKEEDYSHYEQITINTDVMLVNTESKSILSRLPVTINGDSTIELSDEIEVCVKSINGSYEITGNSSIAEHTVLCVNGSLNIHPGTEGILKKFEAILVNGNARYPKSLEGFIGKMNVNGSSYTYPDDCVIMEPEFIIDKYFPLRAKEGSKYYVRKIVIIKDENVDVAGLAGKNVKFVTKKLLIPECKIEDSVQIFDESVEYIVVPDGMKLVCDDITLKEEFVRNEGSRLFIYGDVKVGKNADMDALCNMVEKLIVKGTVSLRAEQEEAFCRMDVEFDKIEIIKKNRRMKGVPVAKVDMKLLDNSPDGIEICGVAKVEIADDITPEMILEKLVIKGCAKVACSEEQESAVAAVSEGVAAIGSALGDTNGSSYTDGSGDIGGIGVIGGMLRGVEELMNTKIINADSYVM